LVVGWYRQLGCRRGGDEGKQQKIKRDHVRDCQHGHVDDRNRVGDAQSRYRAGLPRFGGEGGPVLRGWQTTPWRPRCHLPSERSVRRPPPSAFSPGPPPTTRPPTTPPP